MDKLTPAAIVTIIRECEADVTARGEHDLDTDSGQIMFLRELWAEFLGHLAYHGVDTDGLLFAEIFRRARRAVRQKGAA